MKVQTADPSASQTAEPANPLILPAHLRRIVLTGFMGAGKTTVGRLLAARLGWDFLDLDASIESRTGLAVPSIFAAHSEAHFRQWPGVLPNRFLKQALKSPRWLNPHCSATLIIFVSGSRNRDNAFKRRNSILREATAHPKSLSSG